MSGKCENCLSKNVCRWYENGEGKNLCCADDFPCPEHKPKSRFVELPCEVGSTVYYISFGKVYKGKCHAITIHKDSVQVHLYDFDGDNASYSSKDIYVSKEEAENALKERCKSND